MKDSHWYTKAPVAIGLCNICVGHSTIAALLMWVLLKMYMKVALLYERENSPYITQICIRCRYSKWDKLWLYLPIQRSWKGGILDSPCPSVCHFFVQYHNIMEIIIVYVREHSHFITQMFIKCRYAEKNYCGFFAYIYICEINHHWIR